MKNGFHWLGRVVVFSAASVLLMIPSVAGGADLDGAEKILWRGAYEVAEREIRPAAESGDARAQFLMGNLYQKPGFQKCDLRTSLDWYEKSASQGYAPANTRLGFTFRYGYVGVEKDAARALAYLGRAASSGDPTAQVWLGQMYLEGEGVVRDTERGVLWILEAVRNRNHVARSQLAKLLAAGIGLPKDPEKAYSLLQRSITPLFSPEAKHLLGKLMIELESSLDKKRKGLELVQEAADRGEPEALLTLADFHRRGMLVKIDVSKAEALEKQAKKNSEARMKSKRKSWTWSDPCIPKSKRKPINQNQ